MVRVQKRIYDGLEVLQFFTMRQWDFRTDRFFDLYRELSVKDQEMCVSNYLFSKCDCLADVSADVN